MFCAGDVGMLGTIRHAADIERQKAIGYLIDGE